MNTKATHRGNAGFGTRHESSHAPHYSRNRERQSRPGEGGHIILTGLGILAFLYFAAPVVLPVLLAAVGAMALKPLIRLLTRWHIPRVVAVILVLGVFMTAVGFGFARLKQPVMQWANRAPQYKAQLEQRMDRLLGRSVAAPKPQNPASSSNPNATPKPADPPSAHGDSVQIQDYQGILAWTGATLGESVETIVLLFLLLISGNWFSQKLGQLSHSRHGQVWVRETMEEIQTSISKYLFTVSIINACVGLLVGGGLAVLKFPNAGMWGAMAFLLNFIPYFGPIFGILVLAVVGLFTINSFPQAFFPMAWYTVIHITEADITTPIFLGRRFAIHPVVIFVFLMFSSWIWGLSGALLAVPILVSIKVICERVPALSTYANFLGK